jgi:hypothetical protein
MKQKFKKYLIKKSFCAVAGIFLLFFITAGHSAQAKNINQGLEIITFPKYPNYYKCGWQIGKHWFKLRNGKIISIDHGKIYKENLNPCDDPIGPIGFFSFSGNLAAVYKKRLTITLFRKSKHLAPIMATIHFPKKGVYGTIPFNKLRVNEKLAVFYAVTSSQKRLLIISKNKTLTQRMAEALMSHTPVEAAAIIELEAKKYRKKQKISRKRR